MRTPLALAILLLPLAVGLAGATVLSEHLANGSFELDGDGDGMPDGWAKLTTGYWASTTPTCDVASSADARTGARSLRIHAGGSGVCTAASDLIPVGVGDYASAEVYAKRTNGSAYCFFDLVYYQANGIKELADFTSPGHSSSTCPVGSWGRSWEATTSPAGAAFVRVVFSLQPTSETVTVVYDDASLMMP